jgi:YfiH family protein
MQIYKDGRFSRDCGESIAYGFFGRRGGMSEGVFTSLNCKPDAGDDERHVAQNRLIVAKELGIQDQKISTLSQCHSDQCLFVKKHVAEGEARPEADALVTDIPGLSIGVLTADCGPVLMKGQKRDGSPVIAACHAGWGGALKGVLENTVQKMLEAGALINTISACVGPCILQPSYEVTEDFMQPFVQHKEEAEQFFKNGKEQKMFFDLPGYITFRLSLAGINTVRLMDMDTYGDEENFFSFRRATHRGEKDYGRQISCMVIR